jgi:hypothetical protein
MGNAEPGPRGRASDNTQPMFQATRHGEGVFNRSYIAESRPDNRRHSTRQGAVKVTPAGAW